MSDPGRHRRWLLPVALCVLVICACAPRAGTSEEAEAGATQDAAAPRKGIAISLRELASDIDSPEARSLYGITRIEGFLATSDSRGGDVILVGRKEPRRPALRLDDLMVAYRNIVASRQRPACTIDPSPECIRGLTEVSEKLAKAAGPGETDELLKQWEALCALPQKVGVFGVSANTHFAKVMVDADYYLKSVTNGTEKLKGITSVADILAKALKAEIAANDAAPAPTDFCNRYWFNPGQIRYARRDGMVRLTTCEVVLLTEEEAATPEGELSGLGRPNPYAKEFAGEFTAQFGDITSHKPLYRELESLYRFVALATLLGDKGLGPGGTKVLDDLLRLADLHTAGCPETLPGKYGLKRVAGTRWILPSCGGVSMAMSVGSGNIQTFWTGDLMRLENWMLHHRPSATDVSWSFPLTSPVAAQAVYFAFSLYAAGLIAYLVCSWGEHPRLDTVQRGLRRAYDPPLGLVRRVVGHLEIGSWRVHPAPLILFASSVAIRKLLVLLLVHVL